MTNTKLNTQGFTLKTLIVLCFNFMLINQNINSQNLVDNGSFEIYSEIPRGPMKSSDKFGIESWSCVKNTTPDLFTNKFRNKVGIPKNFMGNQLSKTGEAYIGIIAMSFGHFGGGYKEGVYTQLSEKLEKDKTYCVSMYVSLAENSDYCTNDLGILITQKNLNGHHQGLIPKSKYNQIEINAFIEKVIYNPGKRFITSENWVQICGLYTAEGKEQYLTIGSFLSDVPNKKNKNYGSLKNSPYKEVAYYYIDDVSVVEVTSPEECNCQPIEPEIIAETGPEPVAEIVKLDTAQVGQSIVLNNIYFALNDSTLLDSSFTQLNKLYKTLKKYPQLKIEIAGHTDNIGTTEYNYKLSESRAKAVVDYLEQKGIKTERLKYKGYGNTKPLANNETEEGRQQNRRVEFIIIEK